MKIRRVVAFPRRGPPYVELLCTAIERAGIPCVAGDWSGRSILRDIGKGDLVHLHWPSFSYHDPHSHLRSWLRLAKFAAFLLVIRLRGGSIAWTAHNLYPHIGGRALAVHRMARRIVCRLARVVFVHSRTAADIVAREFRLPARKLVVVHHGHFIGWHPDTMTREAARLRLGVAGSDHVHLFIGNCRRYKNLLSLIDAFRAHPGRESSLLVIAGHFFDDQYFRDVAAAAAEDPRIWLHPGSIPDAHMQVYLRAADSVVLPYVDILTSGAAMLAMSFGRPVIAPAMGSLPDYVPPACGILYRTSERNGLARALDGIRRLRFTERDIVGWVSQFTWERAAATMLEARRPRESVADVVLEEAAFPADVSPSRG